MNKVFIQTQRLIVRQWTLDDVDPLHDIMSDSKVHIFTGDTVWTKERTHEYIQFNINREFVTLSDFHGAVVIRETNEIIGLTGLNPYLPKQPEIEWQLGTKFWDKGFATELGKATIQAAFKYSDVTKIFGMVNPQNIASMRVMEKIGMTSLGMKDFRGEQALFYEILPQCFE